MLNVIRRLFQKTGFDIRRHNILNNISLHQSLILKKLEIDRVIDVGANCGQFGSELRAQGYSGKILSIEPLKDPYARLSLAAAYDEGWEIYQRCAVGRFDGEITINISANSVSSSVLPILNAHLEAEAHSKYIDQEIVAIYKLDTVLGALNLSKEKIFLKIDTQGYEYDVLCGAYITLNDIRGLIIELSIEQLYEGQKNWIEIINFLNDRGFDLYGLHPIFANFEKIKILQVDAIFVRREI